MEQELQKIRIINICRNSIKFLHQILLKNEESAYNNIIKALQEKRLSADSFGNITDQEGKLSNIDEDDYWYNKKGERITGEEYQNLSARKKKRYITFHANKEVATYFSRIAQDIIKKGGATSIY